MIDKSSIRAFLTDLVGKDIAFGDGQSLLASQLIDSLKVAQLVVHIETTYTLTLDGDDLTPENFDSVDAIAAFLERKGVA